jgi:hypothetical protein
MRVFNKVTSICPLRYRGDHTAIRPATLTEVSVRHINKQIEKLGDGPLALTTGEYVADASVMPFCSRLIWKSPAEMLWTLPMSPIRSYCHCDSL